MRDGLLLLAASAVPVASLVVFPGVPAPDVRNSQAFLMFAMANGWAMVGAAWLLVRGYGGAALLAYPVWLQASTDVKATCVQELACRWERTVGHWSRRDRDADPGALSCLPGWLFGAALFTMWELGILYGLRGAPLRRSHLSDIAAAGGERAVMNAVTVMVAVLLVLVIGTLVTPVSLWRHRARGRWQRVARAMGLACLLLVLVYLVYAAVGGAAYAYMIHTYENVRTAQTRADVRSRTPLFRESPGSAAYWVPPPDTQVISKYSLLGLDGWDMHVAYDGEDRALAVVDTYE